MKNIFLKTTGLIMTGLVIANLFVFISGIVISDEINNFEQKTDNLHKINLTLEKEAANLGSIKFALSQAKEFGFTNSTAPQYIDQLKFAYR
ncbi:hypothetical protein CO165_03340 [Candidatus Roizmanbacteria bacterium CG_4_9_14_3_um_filter_33_18]|uniref:Cell division protein FtsL n=2 Tax=Candidatus Roizmaniibacteriota TaxID=1752723 RepID=A0A2M7XXM4_9BACT|nr:MAG: hypothetical protein COW97_03565 [Candidatus Roizmanbacteria bacterium CG22_combo_CG10-13_8_21_14_all_34_12]PJA55481.1 MAG: hypothetical protein CO165_03340 [Candidatus Roizmanbacteria bacterium CG_4_9_14_3_um_filter_33_18]